MHKMTKPTQNCFLYPLVQKVVYVEFKNKTMLNLKPHKIMSKTKIKKSLLL